MFTPLDRYSDRNHQITRYQYCALKVNNTHIPKPCYTAGVETLASTQLNFCLLGHVSSSVLRSSVWQCGSLYWWLSLQMAWQHLGLSRHTGRSTLGSAVPCNLLHRSFLYVLFFLKIYSGQYTLKRLYIYPKRLLFKSKFSLILSALLCYLCISSSI